MSLRRTHNRKPAPTAAATDRLAAVLRAGLRVGAPDPGEPRNRIVKLFWIDDQLDQVGVELISVMYLDGLQGSDTSHPSASGGPELNWTLRRSGRTGGFWRILKAMFDHPYVRAFGTRQVEGNDAIGQHVANAITNNAPWTKKNVLAFEFPEGEWHVLGRVVRKRVREQPDKVYWQCPHEPGTPEYAALFAKLYEYVLTYVDDIHGPGIWLKYDRDGSSAS